MATTNDVTGDLIASRGSSEAFRNNWDAIFGKKDKVDGSVSLGEGKDRAKAPDSQQDDSTTNN